MRDFKNPVYFVVVYDKCAYLNGEQKLYRNDKN